MSERTGRFVVQLSANRLAQLTLLQKAMSEKVGRKVTLSEIVESAIDQMLEGIYEVPQEEEAEVKLLIDF